MHPFIEPIQNFLLVSPVIVKLAARSPLRLKLMPLKRLSFIPQLDSFRFFSVLIVILYHWLPGYNIFHFADVGVGFFFVLSGYLISSNLLYLKQSIDKDEIT